MFNAVELLVINWLYYIKKIWINNKFDNKDEAKNLFTFFVLKGLIKEDYHIFKAKKIFNLL